MSSEEFRVETWDLSLRLRLEIEIDLRHLSSRGACSFFLSVRIVIWKLETLAVFQALSDSDWDCLIAIHRRQRCMFVSFICVKVCHVHAETRRGQKTREAATRLWKDHEVYGEQEPRGQGVGQDANTRACCREKCEGRRTRIWKRELRVLCFGAV